MVTVGPVIVDMVARIRERAPATFGFLICDFFQDDDDINPAVFEQSLIGPEPEREVSGAGRRRSNAHRMVRLNKETPSFTAAIPLGRNLSA